MFLLEFVNILIHFTILKNGRKWIIYVGKNLMISKESLIEQYLICTQTSW